MNERAIEERMRIGKYSNLGGKWLESLIPSLPRGDNGADEGGDEEEEEGGRRIGDFRLKGLRNGRSMNLVIKRLMIEGFIEEIEMIEVLSRESKDSGFKIPQVKNNNKNGNSKKIKGKGRLVKDELEDDNDDTG